MENSIENIDCNIHDDELDSEIVSLGLATELTKGLWGMWPEMGGEEARRD